MKKETIDAGDKRKNRIWLFSVIISAFLVVVCLLVLFNIDNIKALHKATTMNEESIAEEIKKNDEFADDLLSGATTRVMNSLSDIEINKIRKGELTEDEAVDIVLGVKRNKDGTIQNTNNQPEVISMKDTIIAKIYYLRAEYIGKIYDLIDKGKKEASEIKGKDRNLKNRIAFIDKYMKLGSQLENSCDGRMEKLLSQLSAELERTGESKELIDSIRVYYANEKQLKKAELVNKYMP